MPYHSTPPPPDETPSTPSTPVESTIEPEEVVAVEETPKTPAQVYDYINSSHSDKTSKEHYYDMVKNEYTDEDIIKMHPEATVEQIVLMRLLYNYETKIELAKEPTRTSYNGPWKMRDTDKTIKQYYKDDIVTWAGKTYKVIQDVKAKHPSNSPSHFLLIEDKNAPVDGGLF